LVLPLADCVSIMSRRIRAGRSPFVADRHHLHHFLLARGYTHGQTLFLLVSLSTLFGAFGFFAWQLGVSESLMFYPFFFGFFAYHFWIQRAWKKLEAAKALEADTDMFAPPVKEGEEQAVSV
jgi:UDP-GlcNAc:undecaprenyl-phosphate GlcNAc-1-phosphate transferase